MLYVNYNAKTLFTGYKIGLKQGRFYVGVPNTKGEYVKIHHKGKVMTITDYGGFIKWSEWLPDKTYQNNGADYRLGYFEWQPDGEKAVSPLMPQPETEKEQPKFFDIKPVSQYKRERERL